MIPALIMALWFALFLFPPTVRGNNAVHNAFRIVKPQGPINLEGSTTEYAHVQERGEYRLHKLLGMAAGVPFFWMPDSAGFLMFSVMLLVDGGSRYFEGIDYAGHGAEILAAEADGAIGYREAEIERMRHHSDKQGHNVAAGLLRWEWLAHIVWRLGK